MKMSTKIMIAISALLIVITIFTGLVSFILPPEGGSNATTQPTQTEQMF